jgi:hypothetical protein
VLERIISELYAVPLGEFTRARNARASALAQAGRAAEAREVRQLRRPAAPLWAVNRLAHVDPRGLADFVATVDRVRRAQLGDPRGAADAGRRQRAELEGLVERAGTLLGEHRISATPATKRRMSDTLLGAAVDPAHARELRAGRLTEELAAPGFEVLTGAPRGRPLRLVPRSSRPDPPVRARGDVDTERERHLQQSVELQRQATARQAEADDLAREAQELAQKLTAARARVREARRASKTASAAAREGRRAPRRSSPRIG